MKLDVLFNQSDLAGTSPAIVYDRSSDCYYAWAVADVHMLENPEPPTPDVADPEYYILRNLPLIYADVTDDHFLCSFDLTDKRLYAIDADGVIVRISDDQEYLLPTAPEGSNVWSCPGLRTSYYLVWDRDVHSFGAFDWKNPWGTTVYGIKIPEHDAWVWSVPQQNWSVPLPFPLNTVIRGNKTVDGLPADGRNGYAYLDDTENAMYPNRLLFDEVGQSYGLLPILDSSEFLSYYLSYKQNVFYWLGDKPMHIENEYI